MVLRQEYENTLEKALECSKFIEKAKIENESLRATIKSLETEKKVLENSLKSEMLKEPKLERIPKETEPKKVKKVLHEIPKQMNALSNYFIKEWNGWKNKLEHGIVNSNGAIHFKLTGRNIKELSDIGPSLKRVPNNNEKARVIEELRTKISILLDSDKGIGKNKDLTRVAIRIKENYNKEDEVNDQLEKIKIIQNYVPYLIAIEDDYYRCIAYICYINLLYGLTSVYAEKIYVVDGIQLWKISYNQFFRILRMWLKTVENDEKAKHLYIGDVITKLDAIFVSAELIDDYYLMSLANMKYDISIMVSNKNRVRQSNGYVKILIGLYKYYYIDDIEERNIRELTTDEIFSKIMENITYVEKMNAIFNFAVNYKDKTGTPFLDTFNSNGKIINQRDEILKNEDLLELMDFGIVTLKELINIAFMEFDDTTTEDADYLFQV